MLNVSFILNLVQNHVRKTAQLLGDSDVILAWTKTFRTNFGGKFM